MHSSFLFSFQKSKRSNLKTKITKTFSLYSRPEKSQDETFFLRRNLGGKKSNCKALSGYTVKFVGAVQPESMQSTAVSHVAMVFIRSNTVTDWLIRNLLIIRNQLSNRLMCQFWFNQTNTTNRRYTLRFYKELGLARQVQIGQVLLTGMSWHLSSDRSSSGQLCSEGLCWLRQAHPDSLR